MKKSHPSLLAIILIAILITTNCSPGQSGNEAEASGVIRFVDDMKNEVVLKQACERIISLYSAHTENLYSLGAGERIIGVSSTSIYPPEAATKPIYDYDSDPEKVISANPDCLLIRPFIDRKNPDFVAAVRKAGISVISLYPENFEAFDEYIMKLGMMSAADDAAKRLLEEFYANLDAISNKTASIEPRKTVYFESTAANYRTVTIDSMAANAIKLAGGINIATDVEPITEGSTIAAYGVEKILMNADEIDVYITQRGAMNAGDNMHSISIREGFGSVKAVRNGNILEINEKLVSSPTFRYYKGVNEIARALYPEIMDEFESYRSDEMITREALATILVKFTHRPIYVTSSSSYYQQEHSGHVYGLFADVKWDDPSFDHIETAALAGWIDGEKNENGEYFDKEGLVTRDEFAKTVYLLGDFEKTDSHTQINDLQQAKNGKIIQTLVDNQLFLLDNGNFHPEDNLTCNEVIDILTSMDIHAAE